jgi:hypothetical protein
MNTCDPDHVNQRPLYGYIKKAGWSDDVMLNLIRAAIRALKPLAPRCKMKPIDSGRLFVAAFLELYFLGRIDSMRNLKWPMVGAAMIFVAQAATAATVSFVDVIPDAQRDYFYGFENLPGSSSYGSSAAFDNITVSQINGRSPGIWTTYLPGGGEGARAWYPNGGDAGYTSIRTTDGTDFSALGLLSGSGAGEETAYYSLRRDGSEVAFGSFLNSVNLTYVGFTDAIFDEVWLLSSFRNDFGFFGDGSSNALVIDAIEIQVSVIPLPASLPLMFGALIFLGGVGYRRRSFFGKKHI